MTTKRRKSRKGIGKGIPKLRTVFGRRRFHENGDTYIIELHTDGVHVRKLYEASEVRPTLRFYQLVELTKVQLELISAGGEADAKRLQDGNAAKPKDNASDDQEKGKQTQDTQNQEAQAAGPSGA